MESLGGFFVLNRLVASISPVFECTPSLDVMLAGGVRAVQSIDSPLCHHHLLSRNISRAPFTAAFWPHALWPENDNDWSALAVAAPSGPTRAAFKAASIVGVCPVPLKKGRCGTTSWPCTATDEKSDCVCIRLRMGI